MNLSQLRYVKAVAETGSFTLAAEQCHVTQPSLSNGIAQLEQEFDERLFMRSTRQVALTPFGEHILPFIERVLNAQAELLGEVRSHAQPSRAAVRIGTSPLLRGNWLISMLEGFRQVHPNVEIILHEQNMADLYRMLEDGLLDFVFGVAGASKSSWRRAFLYREPLYFVPRGEKYSERGETIKFKEIAGETFVMVPNICGLARATRALFRRHRRKLNEYSGEALGYQVLEEWASLGLGAAILPKSKLQPSERKAYIITDDNGRELVLDFEAVWMRTNQRPAHLQQFEAFLEECREVAG